MRFKLGHVFGEFRNSILFMLCILFLNVAVWTIDIINISSFLDKLLMSLILSFVGFILKSSTRELRMNSDGFIGFYFNFKIFKILKYRIAIADILKTEIIQRADRYYELKVPNTFNFSFGRIPVKKQAQELLDALLIFVNHDPK